MTIFVYADKGVGPKSLTFSLQVLKEAYPHAVRAIDHKTLLNTSWEEESELLVFPGGYDTPFQQSLGGVGNARIKAFVERGGKYLGICAGAYYASSCIEFEKGGKLEIVEKRELGFYPGKAVGPALGLGEFCYLSDKGAKPARIEWEQRSAPFKESFLYYNGGCAFEGDFEKVEVIARYGENKQAAIVLCQVEKGKALLLGVHPEFETFDIENKRLFLWRYLLSLLKINF
jgi:glutamine amidotransferase-like uncharacterized protein